ncbi:hypothetical protein ACYJW8_15960 [Frateuria aurantia]
MARKTRLTKPFIKSLPLPVAAEVITVGGEQMLEVAALTDIPIGDDQADGDSMTMTFRAKLAAA